MNKVNLINFPIFKCAFLNDSSVLCMSNNILLENYDFYKNAFSKINLKNFRNEKNFIVKTTDFCLN